MQIDDLASALRRAYETAGENEKAVSVHLFGIRHAAMFDKVSAHEVAERAGLTRSWGAELRKGANLAKYVQIKTPT